MTLIKKPWTSNPRFFLFYYGKEGKYEPGGVLGTDPKACQFSF